MSLRILWNDESAYMDKSEFKAAINEIFDAEYFGWRLPEFKKKDCLRTLFALIEKSEIDHMESVFFSLRIEQCIRDAKFGSKLENALFERVQRVIDEFIRQTLPFVEDDPPQASYKTLFEYEQAFLRLLRDYHEEVRFVSDFHQELRKERASFFLHTLHNMLTSISPYLKEPGVAQWVTVAFVDDYMKNLQQTEQFAKHSLFDRLREIQKETKRQIRILTCQK